MIPDKERKDHRKMTERLHIPDNDLCSKFDKMDLKSSDTSENNFSKIKVESKRKDEVNENIDAINTIEEKISNLKIFNENDVSTNIEKLNNTASKQKFNIVCDNFEEEKNLCEEQDAKSNKVKDELDDNVKNGIKESYLKEVIKEQNIEVEEHTSNASSHLTSDLQKEDKDSEINENKNEKLEETKKSDKNDKGLCSRGPVFPQKFSQPSFKPYDKGTWINSTNTQSGFLSGGEVLQVAEPLGQPTTAYRQWTDVSSYNIFQNNSEQFVSCIPPDPHVISAAPIAPPVPAAVPSVAAAPVPTSLISSAASGQTSCLPEVNGNIPMEDIIKDIYNSFPVIRSVVNEEIKKSNVQPKITMTPEIWIDEGFPSSPSTIDSSSPGSPYRGHQRSSPSNSEDDSGTESPQPVIDNMGDNSLQSAIVDGATLCGEFDWPPLGQNNPAPITCKSRFQEILDSERKLIAWAKIQSQPDNFFLKADEDGDTQLMIAVSNDYEGHLEIIYAMVERMRKIPSSLCLENNSGLSALYLACKVLNKQPLVAAYIAEALLEQNVDIAELRYENGCTLPEILENEGDTHVAVLKELLALKDNSGRFAFPMHRQNEFFYKNRFAETGLLSFTPELTSNSTLS